MKKLIFTFWMLLTTSILLAQTTPLDTTFAYSGINILPIIGNYTAQIKTASQSDNKIVVCTSKEVATDRFDICVIRFHENGLVDSSFGTNGVVLHDLLSPEDEAIDIYVQADDKILIAGNKGTFTNRDFIILRLNSDGSIDEEFGENGLVSFHILYDDVFNVVIEQEDGKIVAAGSGESCGYIYRLMPDGQVDATFGNNGKVKLDFGNISAVTDIIPYENNRLIAVGMIAGMASSNAFVVSLNADGSFNQDFGTGGKYLLNSTNQERISTVICQPDGKIVVGGAYAITTSTVLYKLYLLRLLSSGVPDPSFNNTGVFMTPVGTNALNYCSSLALNSAGEILATGSTTTEDYTASDLAIVKVTQKGSLDSTFGTNGIYISDFENDYEFGISSFCKADNKLVISGYSGAQFYPIICRFNTTDVTDVKELEVQKLKIYPNPCTTSITIESPNYPITGKTILSVMDINGQLLYTLPLRQNTDRYYQINTDYLKNGVYILRFASENVSAVGKLVKL